MKKILEENGDGNALLMGRRQERDA